MLLDGDAIRQGLPAGVARRVGLLEVLPETASTNARVLAAERPVGELGVCLAEYQSAGRGRR
ncbi:MAG TPA: bifunctional biotin--[acetyl-CoA-carboxylase] synthetase/biotin operon repressor, partial [Gammaproteobacteria bacterium]|nr:bifunctional biotin--[acetyl-CoA-carboxylase] synthetase/biotin operon repressor [Gammaproteobacteria bacterium]